jgi:hypothetical protein
MLATSLLNERTSREQTGQAKPPYSSDDERMYGSSQLSDLSFGKAWGRPMAVARPLPYNSLMRARQRSTVTPDDDAFVGAFFSGRITNQQFHHRDHLRLAWVQIRRLGFGLASESVTGGIRAFATRHGSADRYHDTMTRFWLRVVDLGIRQHPDLTFDELLVAEPHLLDKGLPFRHWSRETMSGDSAKRQWVEPDMRPMPA